MEDRILPKHVADKINKAFERLLIGIVIGIAIIALLGSALLMQWCLS